MAIGLIKLQFLWQFHGRLNYPLVPRARSHIIVGATGVIASRPIFHVHLQMRIRGFQFPPTRWLPIGRHFEAFRAASDSVAGELRNHRMHRRWRVFNKWRAYLKAIDIAIVVIEQRKIEIEVRRHQGPESGFIGDQFFGTKLAVAVYAKKNGQSRRRRIIRELDVLVDPRGSSDRSGNRGPEGLSGRAVPEKTRARLHLETVVVVMSELRAQG